MTNDGSGSSLTRRGFLAGSAGLWIAAALPRPRAHAAARAGAAPAALTPEEWRCVDAITERIIPADETPGASAAGCVAFIDQALAFEDAEALPRYRAALAALDRACHRRFERPFAELPAESQDAVLADLEDGKLSGWSAPEAPQAEFFATVRTHTVIGFLADPRFGGNRDFIGWKTMGFPGPVHHMGGSRPAQLIGEDPFVPIWERKSADATAEHVARPDALSRTKR